MLAILRSTRRGQRCPERFLFTRIFFEIKSQFSIIISSPGREDPLPSGIQTANGGELPVHLSLDSSCFQSFVLLVTEDYGCCLWKLRIFLIW
jgi:hypothetical protein